MQALSMLLDLEGELVAADADSVTIEKGGTGTNSLVLHLHAVGRSQIGNHETATSVDDYGVVPADIVVVQNDVVVGRRPIRVAAAWSG